MRIADCSSLRIASEAIACCDLCDGLGLPVIDSPASSPFTVFSSLSLFSASAVILPHRKVWTKSGLASTWHFYLRESSNPMLSMPVSLRCPQFYHLPRVLGLRTLHARNSTLICLSLRQNDSKAMLVPYCSRNAGSTYCVISLRFSFSQHKGHRSTNGRPQTRSDV